MLASLLWRIVAVLALTLAAFHPIESAVGPMPAFVACLVLGAVLLHLLIVRRLRGLNRALDAVETGEDRPDLPRPSRDEIGRLTRSIEGLATKLRSHYEELREHDELRRRMVANVSHELRTPLTSIQGYLETAKLAGPGSPDFESNLEVCLRETRKLSRLVQDLFQLSKLDTQQLEFHFETVSLVELADQVALAFEQRMADKEITFTTEFPEDDPLEVRADGNRLAQVVQNLLGNAAVFTGRQGKVHMACAAEDGRAVLRVSDTGIGISEKDQPHIFESFFHLEKSRTRNLGGTGLGLAICKAIITAHDGEISVKSRVGEGTTFTVALDLALPKEEASR